MPPLYGFLIICGLVFGLPYLFALVFFWRLGKRRDAMLLTEPAPAASLNLPAPEPEPSTLTSQAPPTLSRPEHEGMDEVTPAQTKAALARIEDKKNATITLQVLNHE